MFERIVDEPNQVLVKLEELKKRVLSKQNVYVVLYGAGYCGHEALSLMRQFEIPVMAVCDDGRIGQDLDGIAITDIKDIKPCDGLEIYTTYGYYDEMLPKIKKLGLFKYYKKIDFSRFDLDRDNYRFFQNNKEHIERVYDLMADDMSKVLLESLIRYRISRNPKYIENIRETTPQYFPDTPDLRNTFHRNRKEHIFFDLGAYDGDSIRGFLDYTCGKYEKIYAAEVSEKNYEILLDKCKNIERKEFFHVGISDKHGMIRFSITDSKNSFANPDGEELFEVNSVDNLLDGRDVTFIKMDIEGAEMNAVKGAANTIRRCCPIMAISVYHKTEDLFCIQLEIERIAAGAYDFYLRHYSPTMIETILYAVPKKA